ncbi:hypothetical protein VCV18_008533 [Metarhizium anisopliae]
MEKKLKLAKLCERNVWPAKSRAIRLSLVEVLDLWHNFARLQRIESNRRPPLMSTQVWPMG